MKSQRLSRKEEGKAAERKVGSVIAEVSKMTDTLFRGSLFEPGKRKHRKKGLVFSLSSRCQQPERPERLYFFVTHLVGSRL